MSVARGYAIANVLPDGTVLVYGGSPVSGGVLASTDIYQPGQQHLDARLSISQPRQLGTTTLLQNGPSWQPAGNGLATATKAARARRQLTVVHAPRGRGRSYRHSDAHPRA